MFHRQLFHRSSVAQKNSRQMWISTHRISTFAFFFIHSTSLASDMHSLFFFFLPSSLSCISHSLHYFAAFMSTLLSKNAASHRCNLFLVTLLHEKWIFFSPRLKYFVFTSSSSLSHELSIELDEFYLRARRVTFVWNVMYMMNKKIQTCRSNLFICCCCFCCFASWDTTNLSRWLCDFSFLCLAFNIITSVSCILCNLFISGLTSDQSCRAKENKVQGWPK